MLDYLPPHLHRPRNDAPEMPQADQSKPVRIPSCQTRPKGVAASPDLLRRPMQQALVPSRPHLQPSFLRTASPRVRCRTIHRPRTPSSHSWPAHSLPALIRGSGGPVPLLARRSRSRVPGGPTDREDLRFVVLNRPSNPLTHSSSACPPSQNVSPT